MTRRYSDLILALFVMAITAMLVIPLPTALLDVLIVINISLALLLLLVGLYMPNALALLSFPTLLLLTTLFRLGLNVASTRLILSQGDAGTVIEAFGTFLVRGEVVVGIIIFSIITIVNFIVIARGSSRVSEVAARFTLDALPGKQMAIDAELRTGSMTNEEARERRDDLRKESQLYGSMDGAMKFVQGDAIAGLFIILTNILGGIYLGVAGGMSFQEAVNTYTILTVGDGLVTQIPALLISICAGVVVTRVSSGENTTLGTDLGAQLFSNPTTVMLTGGILMLLGILPGIPKIPFLTVAIVFLITGFLLKRSHRVAQAQSPLKVDFQSGAIALLGPPKAEEDLSEDHVVTIFLDSVVSYRLYKLNAQKYTVWWQELRAEYFHETGMKLPDLRVVADDMLAPASYVSMYGSTVIERDQVVLDSVVVDVNPDSAHLFGLEVIREVAHPVTHHRIFWAANADSVRYITESAQIRFFDFFEFVGIRAATFFLNHPEEVLTLSEVHSSLKQLEKRHPGFVADVLARNFIDVPRLAEVLQQLVREGLSVRDFKQIVESVASYCSTNGITAADSDSLVLTDIVSHIRLIKRRQFLTKLVSSRGTLRVCTLSKDLEDLFDEVAQDSSGSVVPLEPEIDDRLRSNLTSLLKPVYVRGVLPVSLLVRSDLRHLIETFVKGLRERIRVLSFDELEPNIDVEQIGVWSIG